VYEHDTIMRMSQAATEAGVNVQTIRYYERRGLLPRPPRLTSGYRELERDTIRRVRFIKRAQELGFTLDEVAQLLRLRAARPHNRARVRAIAERRLDQIEQKIAQLRALRKTLRTLVDQCREGTALDCPIIEAFEQSTGDRS
jgi:Hg(II)-responsive transcriptional regulator